MTIETVKSFGDNLIVNGKVTIPKDNKNRIYRSVNKWLRQNSGYVVEEYSPMYKVDNKNDAIENDYTSKKNKISQKFGLIESPTFEYQRLEAILSIYIKEAQTPFIDGISEATGETKHMIAKKILKKSNEEMFRLGKLTGQMQNKKKGK